MDTIDLFEMRKRLYSYKQTGPEQIKAILKQLQMSELTREVCVSSKIHKTLHTLSKIDPVKDADHSFTQKDLNYVKEMAKSLLSQVNEVRKDRKNSAVSVASAVSAQSNDQQTSDSAKKPTTTTTSTKKTTNYDILEELDLPKGFPDHRQNVIKRLIELMMQKADTLISQFPALRFKKLAQKLEEETFNNHQTRYREIIKQMMKYLQQDEDGSVRSRFLRGLIEPSQAVLVRTEDWMGDQRLKESRQVASETIKANDIQHFKRVAQAINKDVVLGQCNQCGEKQLKLVDEKQTRASDEPSTKFWECLNCGYAETTN